MIGAEGPEGMRGAEGAVKFLVLLGPVGGPLGARKPAGPRGGDRGIAAERTGERGVDLADSRSRKVSCVTGERSRVGGERFGSRVL
jgi:hypothetical protein